MSGPPPRVRILPLPDVHPFVPSDLSPDRSVRHLFDPSRHHLVGDFESAVRDELGDRHARFRHPALRELRVDDCELQFDVLLPLFENGDLLLHRLTDGLFLHRVFRVFESIEALVPLETLLFAGALELFNEFIELFELEVWGIAGIVEIPISLCIVVGSMLMIVIQQSQHPLLEHDGAGGTEVVAASKGIHDRLSFPRESLLQLRLQFTDFLLIVRFARETQLPVERFETGRIFYASPLFPDRITQCLFLLNALFFGQIFPE